MSAPSSTSSPVPQSQELSSKGGFLILAGIIAAGLCWIAVHLSDEVFELPTEPANVSRLSPEQFSEYQWTKKVAESKRAALAVVLFGGILGTFLGAMEGFSRNNSVGLFWGITRGILYGLLFGIAGGIAGIYAREQVRENPYEVSIPAAMAMHGAMWLMGAIGVGLTVSWPTRSKSVISRVTLASLGAGLVAGLLYAPLAATLFPTEDSELPVPEGFWNRLLAVGLPALLVTVAVIRSGRNGSHLTPQPEDDAPQEESSQEQNLPDSQGESNE